jgi:hypothetical protein
MTATKQEKKQSIVLLLAALLLTLSLASCSDYRKPDPTVRVGYLLLDNHDCVSYDSYRANPTGKPVGVVFAQKTADHPVLAVMLDELNEAFCDSVGMANGTSGELTKYDGFENTMAMYKSYDENTHHGSPLAMKMMAYHENGQSDYIPSVAEMRLLCHAAPVINKVIAELGGTPLQLSGDCWYWTSTEVASNKELHAWLISSVNGGILATPKNQAHRARAIVRVSYTE